MRTLVHGRTKPGRQRRSSNTAPDAGVNGYSAGEQISIRKKEKNPSICCDSPRGNPRKTHKTTSKHNNKKNSTAPPAAAALTGGSNRSDWGFVLRPASPRFSSAQFDRRSADNNSICYNSNPHSRQGHPPPPSAALGAGEPDKLKPSP